MKAKQLIVLALVAILIATFFIFDLGQYFSLAYIKSQQAAVIAQYDAHPALTIAIFFVVYVAVAGLSLPGAAIMTLFAGGIFGLVVGLVTVSFASSIGATFAFLTSRFLLRDSIQAKFGDKLRAINQGIEREGAFYLFSIRMVPAFPFFIVNLVMGLTPLKTTTFYWASQLGMLIGTAVYVNAGMQLAQIDSLRGILSPGILGAFALLGVFPIVAKKLVDVIKARKIYRRWAKPRRFDRNLVVIGAGSAGLVSAYIGAAVKARVTLIEKHRMGGDCLNTGCVPSKALIRSAKYVSHIRRAKEFGMTAASVDFNFAAVMDRVQNVIKTIAPHDSPERYASLGVECIEGTAKITSPWSVEVRTPEGIRTLTTRNIVIAAGARPFVPAIPGLDQIGYLTSDTVWSLRTLPKRLVVLGGGPIGAELAQAFARLGADVTQIEMLPRILFREDPEVARVGLNETEAKEKGIAYEVTTYGLDDLDRAIADGEAHGMVKVLTVPGKDKILGVTIVGEHAGDLIAEFVAAMKNKLGLRKILGTIHIYPTLAEANKFAAGNWKRAHAPAKLMPWLERLHAWERGERAATVSIPGNHGATATKPA